MVKKSDISGTYMACSIGVWGYVGR